MIMWKEPWDFVNLPAESLLLLVTVTTSVFIGNLTGGGIPNVLDATPLDLDTTQQLAGCKHAKNSEQTQKSAIILENN